MRRIDSPDGRLYEHDGKLYPSVSTVLKLMESPFLQREYPVGIALRAAYDNPDDNVKEWAEKALAKLDEKAGWGTRLHEYVEAKLKGTPWDAETLAAEPIQVRNLVKSFEQWLTEHTLEPWFLEAGLVNTTHGYAGTPDFFGLVDGVPLCVDYKTGTDVWGSVQLQLTALMHGESFPDLDEPVPPVKGGAVLHVRPKSCTLIPVMCGTDQWHSFLYLLEGWRVAQRYHRRLTNRRGE